MGNRVIISAATICIPSNYLNIHILHLICHKSIDHLPPASQNSLHILGLKSEKYSISKGGIKGT